MALFLALIMVFGLISGCSSESKEKPQGGSEVKYKEEHSCNEQK